MAAAGPTRFAGALRVTLRVIEVAGVVAIFLIMIHSIANVVLRYLGAPLFGTNEWVAGWYLPLTAFLGFVVAKASGEHIEARLLFDRFSPKNQRVLAVITGTISAVTLLYFGYQTTIEALHAASISMTIGVSGIILWPVLWIVPLGLFTLAVMFGADAFRDARRSSGVRDRSGVKVDTAHELDHGRSE